MEIDTHWASANVNNIKAPFYADIYLSKYKKLCKYTYDCVWYF